MTDQPDLRHRIAEALMRWAEQHNAPQYAPMRRPETVTRNAYSRVDAVLAEVQPALDKATARGDIWKAKAVEMEADRDRLATDRDRLRRRVDEYRASRQRWMDTAYRDRRYAGESAASVQRVREVPVSPPLTRLMADEEPSEYERGWAAALAAVEAALDAPAAPAVRTPCSQPDPCKGGEPCDTHATERAHAAGDHSFCDITCEASMPSDQMRNFIIAKGYPGTAGALDELLRRAADRPADDTQQQEQPCICGGSGITHLHADEHRPAR